MANELYDGTRVFTAAAGATALAADQNTIQDQIILGVEARERAVSLVSGVVSTANWALTYNTGGSPDMYWADTTPSANGILLFPVDLRAGEYITEASIWVSGAAGAPTGGEILLHSQTTAGTDADANDITDFGATGNFWATAGSITKYTDATVNHQVTVDDDYFIEVKGPSGGAVSIYLYGILLKTRFHFGA